MGLLTSLEASGLAEWVRMSTLGYPMMITLHAIGMSIMVGLCLMIDLRLLGRFAGIPYSAIHRLLGLAWIGFGINSLSGAALFSAQATEYIVHTIFMTKMFLVFLGAVTAAVLQTALAKADTWDRGQAPAGTRVVAALSIVFWLGAIVTGRLTAYL